MRALEEGLQDSAEASEARKREELQRSLWDLGLSWGLVLVCCTHHLGHWLHGLGWHGLAHGPLLNALANPTVSLALGSVALLGPGRPLIKDGLVSLARSASLDHEFFQSTCQCSCPPVYLSYRSLGLLLFVAVLGQLWHGTTL